MPFSTTRRPTSGAVRTTSAARRPSYLDKAPRVMPFSPDPSADQRSCADDGCLPHPPLVIRKIEIAAVHDVTVFAD